ncbi:MAG: universal stress protein [Chitinophagaceae bacterium]|nr:universal stress protein [Chitinophagaceae bacterium]
MHKILLLVTHGFPHHILDFAKELCMQDPCKVTAIFTDSLKRVDKDSYLFPSDINATETDFTKASDEEEEAHMLEDKMKLFIDYCEANSIDHAARKITGNYLENINDETAFADYVLCDADLDLELFSLPNFISSSHCPVLLIPDATKFFDHVIFTFDGHMSSIHAMKQFAYLFSKYKQLKVSLVTVLPPGNAAMDYDQLVREWISVHFPNAAIEILQGDVKSQLPAFINQLPKSIVVMGAFGRNALSKLFKESLVPAILKGTKAPLFISHI